MNCQYLPDHSKHDWCTDVCFTEPKAAGHRTICDKVSAHNFGQNINLSLTVKSTVHCSRGSSQWDTTCPLWCLQQSPGPSALLRWPRWTPYPPASQQESLWFLFCCKRHWVYTEWCTWWRGKPRWHAPHLFGQHWVSDVIDMTFCEFLSTVIFYDALWHYYSDIVLISWSSTECTVKRMILKISITFWKHTSCRWWSLLLWSSLLMHAPLISTLATSSFYPTFLRPSPPLPFPVQFFLHF